MQKNKPIRDTIQLMKKNWKKIGLIVTFDVLFILSLFNLWFASNELNSWLLNISSTLSGTIILIISLLALIINSLVLVVIYSFFKYIVLGNIHEIFKKEEFTFNRFFSFLKLNFIIILPIMLFYTVFFISTMAYLGKKMAEGANNQSFLILLLLGLFMIMVAAFAIWVSFYTLLNLAHSMFLKERNLKKILKQSLAKSFKFKAYKIYWSNLKIIAISLGVLAIFYSFMKLFVLSSMTSYLKYGGIYKTGITLIIILAIYSLLLFNRINFYQQVMDD